MQAGGAIAHGNVWSESRKELEVAIHAEKAKDHSDWNPDLQSEEQRLRKRLAKLNLDMKVMVGDGNCQVSTPSPANRYACWNVGHRGGCAQFC